ncbi:transposase [Brachionus plicatilis]|uniref:Transposase n=1 Tax=Brachionus plicatilis TaxID=10195 RepID=A0A3M7QFH2_BRAPC|nr:transposase [Brachionus plicatilis]
MTYENVHSFTWISENDDFKNFAICLTQGYSYNYCLRVVYENSRILKKKRFKQKNKVILKPEDAIEKYGILNKMLG